MLAIAKSMEKLNYGSPGEMRATVPPPPQEAATASRLLRFKFRGEKDTCRKAFPGVYRWGSTAEESQAHILPGEAVEACNVSHGHGLMEDAFQCVRETCTWDLQGNGVTT